MFVHYEAHAVEQGTRESPFSEGHPVLTPRVAQPHVPSARGWNLQALTSFSDASGALAQSRL